MVLAFNWLRAKRFKTGLMATTFLSLVCQRHAAAQPFSLLCMPDPQYYTTSDHPARFNMYNRQANWIKDNVATHNIKHVLWLGDLTNDNTIPQWTAANAAYTILDNANIPYALIPGNHDYKTSTGWKGVNFRDLTYYNAAIGPPRFMNKAWYGGNMGNTTTNNENSYTYFSANGMDFLCVGLEFAPRKEVLTWANNLISQHPNHRVVIFTHGYLGNNGVYVGQAGSSYCGLVGAAGAEIFTECANRHSNVFLVVCGHVTDSVVNTRTGVNGNRLYEMLVDYQSEKVKGTGANLGNGWLRILRFDPSANQIYASTVTAAPGDSNVFNGGNTQFYLTDRYASTPLGPDHLFTLSYNMTAPMEPYSYLIGTTSFHTSSVNNDLKGDQQWPDIAQADNGNYAVTWQDDTNHNGVFNIYVRGFDADGNVRFEKTIVNPTGQDVVSGTKPTIAMAGDGRFVVAWQSAGNEIKARTYNANGTPVGAGALTLVSATGNGTVNNPDVAMDNSGNFVVTWADDTDGNGSFQIKAGGYNFNLGTVYAPATVNTDATGQQVNPAIAMSANGNHVITWEDNKAGTWDLGLRGFLPNGTELFSQRVANSTIAGTQVTPDVAMDDSGRFVVTWGDDNDLNGAYEIYARGFAANGGQLFAERVVNVQSSGNQVNPAVAMDNAGNWYPVWEDNGVGGQGYQIVGNVFDISGTRINTADTRINAVASVENSIGTPARKAPVITAHHSGRYIVAWADDMDGNGDYQALARGVGGTARFLAVKSHYGIVSRSSNNGFYAPNEQVSLTATANPGYTFTHWSGDVPAGSQNSNPINLTMNANKTVTANYEANSHVDGWELFDQSLNAPKP